MNIETEFQNSIRYINNLNLDYYIDEAEKLKLYGLYKQALFGDNIAPRPYFFNIKSVNKWYAWKKHFGKTKYEAKTDSLLATSGK